MHKQNVVLDPTHILDRVVLMERLYGDVSILCTLIDLFREECPRLIADAHTALERRDPAGLARAAHSLKGAFANLSAGQARATSERLESAARAEDLHAAREALFQIEEDTTQVEEAMAAMVRACTAQKA